MEECEIPGEHEFVYEMDSQGVFQVYKNEQTRKWQLKPLPLMALSFSILFFM